MTKKKKPKPKSATNQKSKSESKKALPKSSLDSNPPLANSHSVNPKNAVTKTVPPLGKPNVSRYVSFGILLAIILIFAFLFYEVMANFLIPLFLAALLVVVFRPLHRWILEKVGEREKTAAIVTTSAVMLTVLVPLALLLSLAAIEGKAALRDFNSAQIYDGIRKVRSNFNLDLPPGMRVIESELATARQNLSLGPLQEDQHQRLLYDVANSAKRLASAKSLDWPELPPEGSEQVTTEDGNEISAWEQFATDIQLARRMHSQMTWRRGDSEIEETANNEALLKYQLLLNQTAIHFEEVRLSLLGGKTKASIIALVNPSSEETKSYIDKGTNYFKENILVVGRTGASFLGSLLLGTAIMVIGLYFFLLDGPKMIESFKGLSPIDDEHEQELVSEFSRVSRAVVVATLLSALVQGLLAGIGFYFAGLESVFLLTVLSAVLAMVPFVGAAAVWIPCCLYLYFIDNNLTAAIGLTIYGVAVISMADNVIKPFVLHGQSNLHPLLALLSVLGGVTALGPIGILIGPMVVAFLQTLLKILQREMQAMDQIATKT